MLRTRVITAIVLLLVLLPSLFYLPAAWWTAAVILMLMVAAWEWTRLAQWRASLVWPYVLATGIAGLAIQMGPLEVARAGYGVALLFWVVVVPLLFFTGIRPKGWLAALAGWCVLLPFGRALVDLRELGPWLLLSVMALVWLADIAAYFAGRAFGTHKLAPSISPGKTWEGVAGAVTAVALYVIGSLFWSSPLLSGGPVWLAVAIVAIGLTAVSVLGDLFESAMKRAAGLKDSSGLLPGHGGVLDRIDALTSTLPVAALLLIWSGKL